MRAMPSPTSMTRPTSWRSTSASYPASWRLMISLISPALIIGPSSASREAFSDPCELSVQAAIHDGAPDLGHEAAEEARVHDFLENHVDGLADLSSHITARLAARARLASRDQGTAEGGLQLRPLVLRQRHRRSYPGADTSEILVDHVSVGL